MDHNTYNLHSNAASVGPIYYIASRRAEQAARRGDVKGAASWLAIAERHIAVVERIDRRRIADTRLLALLTEHSHRLKALENHARFLR